jgi:DNA-binding transcriptional MerR regulator
MIALVRAAAGAELDHALALAEDYLAHVRGELQRAEAAVLVLESWISGQTAKATIQPMRIGEAVIYLDVTADQLRNWDRSGLLEVPRDPISSYRVYGSAEIGRLRVIRLLRQSGYSLMAILRMLRQVDAGQTTNLRAALDTPVEDEGIQTVADRWLTTLAQQEQRGLAIIGQIGVLAEIET